MTPHQILIVAIRLFAIVWFFHALGHLATALRLGDQLHTEPLAVTLTWAFPFLELLACLFLWFAPATLARKLLPHGDIAPVANAPDLTAWQTMGVILVGLWTLTYSIPDAAYWLVYARWHFSEGGNMGIFFSTNRAEIVATALQLLVGLWLLLGAKGFAAYLLRIRSAGLKS